MNKTFEIKHVKVSKALLDYLKPSNEGRCTKWNAYFNLLSKASTLSGHVTHFGQEFDLVPGEFVTSISELAKEWHWQRATVRHFLEELVSLGQLSQESYVKCSRINMVALRFKWMPQEHPFCLFDDDSLEKLRISFNACDQITSSINESVSGQDSGTDKDYVDKEGNILYSHEQRKTVVYHYHTIALSIYKHLVEDTYSPEVEKALLDTYYKRCDGGSEKMQAFIKDLFADVAQPLNMMGFEIYHEFKESLISLLSQIPSEHCETKSQSDI